MQKMPQNTLSDAKLTHCFSGGISGMSVRGFQKIGMDFFNFWGQIKNLRGLRVIKKIY
mgnify:CR=1 FL=1